MSTLLPDHIVQSIRDICRQHNAYLIDIIVRGSTQKRVIEIYVDTESGITLDQCGVVSHDIGELLESNEVFSGQYRLEVSSPGAARPLEYPWQYRRHTGRLLKVDLTDGTQKQGRLTGVGDTSFTLEEMLKKRETTLTEIPFDSVKRAVVELEW